MPKQPSQFATSAPVPMRTPPAVAKRLGVTPAKVIAWIRAGELTAIDVSLTPGVGRPRFRIDPVDLAEFEAARQVVVTPRTKRRRKRDPGIHQYF